MSEINRWSLRCESVTNDDATHRYILRIEWNKEKPKATVILIQPASAIPVELDMTTMNIINNLNRLEGEGYSYEETFRIQTDDFKFFVRLKPVSGEYSYIFSYVN